MTLLEYYRENVSKDVVKVNLLYLSPNYDPEEDNPDYTLGVDGCSLWVNSFYDEVVFNDGTKKYFVNVNEYGTHLKEVDLVPHLCFCNFEKDVTDCEVALNEIRG